MKKIEDIRIITREEGKIIFEAIHKFLFTSNGKKGFLFDKNKKKVLEVNQIYQDFKSWMNEED